MYDVILSFITAFVLTYFAIPSVIMVARVKRLFDDPNERSSHSVSIPSLGGIAIFAGLIFSVIFWTPFDVFGDLQYILCSLVLIFLIGAKDDIVPMRPSRKFMGQIFAALIMVLKADVRISSLYGLFNVYDLPFFISVVLSVFVIVLIINAFNLIDGINGLTGTISVIITMTFGYWFFMVERVEIAIVCFSLMGAIIAFLKYNYTPAQIFMGDTGSLVVGLISATLAIKFMEINLNLVSPYAVKSIPGITIGILIIPLYDTLRVFTTRILKGKSPFYPDKTHIHHLLLDLGFSHLQGTAVLAVTNILFIVMVFALQDMGVLPLLILVLVVATILSGILYYLARKKRIEQAKKAIA
jgi:UDP-N-acetylmuramyl pentapeptide phosphotransferase/UDP-N-acetylglucosamine-1-phosphate transferase